MPFVNLSEDAELEYLRTVGDPENLTYAINLFDKAITVNPEFAEPYAGKCEGLLGLYSEARVPALFSEALR